MNFRNLRQIRASLYSGEYTLPEIVENHIGLIEGKNPDINAVISVDKDRVRQQAEHIQQKINDETAGKLAGLVLGIKDLICEQNEPATCASDMLADFESIYDATVIKKLKKEDALFLGRLNMDEFAMGSSNEYSRYGPVKNPYDHTRVSGGSSGGSAAAVASGFCRAALGSDTGGSIRQPASFCSTVGLKPTYGRVSRHGLIAFASSFDCIGPLTHTIEEAAQILEVIAGSDPNDDTCSNRKVPSYPENLANTSSQIRIGVPEEYFGEGLDSEIREGIENHLSQLEKDGAELIPIHLPHMKYGVATYYILAMAEASSNLARYDGIRYGHRADIDKVEEELKKEKTALNEQIEQAAGKEKIKLSKKMDEMDSPLIRLYKKSRTEGFGTEVKRRIMLGTYVLSAGYYEAYYAKAQKVRRLIKNDFEEAFRDVDVIVSPTTPGTAFEIGKKIEDPVKMYLNDIYTISANLAGICAINVPAGRNSNGLPYGIQFMADAFEESRLFNAGRLIERLH